MIQRITVQVGFDGTPTQSMFAESGNQLTTSGVANCIVVVVWDRGGQGAVMRHYDTLNAWQGTRPDPVSGGDALTWNINAFNTLRQEMINQLQANIQSAGYEFSISLGGIWSNADQSSPIWLSRMNLIQMIIQVFGIEPTRAEPTSTFDTTHNIFI